MPDYDPQVDREMPDTVGRPPGDLVTDEDDLRTGITGLAHMISGPRRLQDLLAQIASYAARAIPGATGAGVSLVRLDGKAKVQAWGATEDVVVELDRIQYDLLDEGPCTSCMQTRRTAVSGSLGTDERWPRFGVRAARLDMHSALSLPLMVDDQIVGAINAYARDRDAFTAHAVEVGERFATPAAVAARNAQLLDAASTKAEQLQTALISRAVIDQAIGIVLSRTGGTADEALARLKQISQAENVKLALVARRIVDEAVRRAQARHAPE